MPHWNESIRVLKGMGPKRMELFEKLGIRTIRDLLFHFPFRYEDIQVRELGTILDQEKVTLKGTIVSPPVVNFYGHKKSRLSFRMAVSDSEIIQVTFFNQPYLKKQLELGQVRAIYGKWQSNQQSLLGMKMIKEQTEGDTLSAVYPTVKGLKQTTLETVIRQGFEYLDGNIPEIIPHYLNEKYRMWPMGQALYYMHFPKEMAEHQQAKRKIIFSEFFLYQWRLLNATAQDLSQKGVRVYYDVDELKSIISQLPYELTRAQKKSVNDICSDLMAPFPMKRMVQGDVGSGKTLVAFLAMIASVLAGYQVVLMVPTEILAKQHTENFNRLFEPMNLHAECLVSALKAKEKKQLVEGLASGRIRIVIGTHALIQEQIEFKQLGLVVIDEQHRFGVNQRQMLLNKNEVGVNLLQMTATPIPRSLAMTVYGELSVSTIDELPGGRQPITTERLKADAIDTVYQRMDEELAKGHQVYYVLPLIDASETMQSIDNVNEVAETLIERFSNYQVDVLHGQLDKAAQQEVMEQFKQNHTQILVATTMVEVGVDVPNATIIVIQSAERFGLAQLHQLRGRVGRSSLQSYCYLIGNPTTDQGDARLDIMTQTQDGFRISQEDMKIRGMGDLLGKNQSGIPQFHYANLIEDQHILTIARQEAKQLIEQPYLLSESEAARLQEWNQQLIIEV
ncbi:ATP-dependent DNA helicase RecG [Tuanshanicoccus yangjingiae]|uniref:ATP-dependent DNA helicase RecG n=1 Tax=Aerococcaceae bacterium zg-252 TaxID=2796928 RepID=UPI004064570F